MSLPRPSRKAALAARDAIASTAVSEQDLAVEAAGDISKKQRSSEVDTDYLGTKRGKVTHAVQQTGLPAHLTDPFRYLPLEILLEIVSYLDPQNYNILQLIRTSKTWRVALTSRCEGEWEKKCKAMGAKMKARGCSTGSVAG